MEKISYCPICNKDDFFNFIECEDYFFSKEKFTISECKSCSLKLTNPRPESSKISKYYESESYISHSGNSGGFISGLYNLIKSYTLSRKFILINKYSVGPKILDIGCATGDFLALFKKKKWDTYGYEPNKKAGEKAIEKHNITLVSDEDLNSFMDGYFNVITLWHVAEHIHLLNDTFKNINRILNEKGLLIIAVPNASSYDATHYSKYWAGYDVPRHLYHFNHKNINDLLKKHNFKIIKKIPMLFDSFYVSLLSEKYRTGKMNYIKGFLIGFISNLHGMINDNYSSTIYVAEKCQKT